MEKLIYGSLVLHANRSVPDIDVPALRGMPRKIGHHYQGRHNGGWTEVSNLLSSEAYLPQRYKHFTLTTTNEVSRNFLTTALEELDSRYPNARQLYKLNRLLASVPFDFTAVVNIASAEQEGTPVSGSFYLLSQGRPLWVGLVFDLETASVQLVWATFDFKADMQAHGMFRYVFYPMPKLLDRPLFVHTQNLCARWWKLMKSFGEDRHGIMRAANALELILYKDPTVENYGSSSE